ncbi:transposase [Burkholderia thailandensis]|uniref:transposase n=1 Tax=Burkholderia thailandensis TaxID=57975 RepID=UPI003B513434
MEDSTIIAAPPSTKNTEKSRGLEMHQTKKGNEWHFGVKAYICVDAESGLIHSLVGTAVSAADVSQDHALLHGHAQDAFGDAGYVGVDKRDEMKGKAVKWQVASKRGKIKAMTEGPRKNLLGELKRTKAQTRARAEHPSFMCSRTCFVIARCGTQGFDHEKRRSCSAYWSSKLGDRE